MTLEYVEPFTRSNNKRRGEELVLAWPVGIIQILDIEISSFA